MVALSDPRSKASCGFVSKGLIAILIKIGAAGASFVMFVALARAMQADSFGTFGAAFSAATLLAVLGSLGQRNVVLRFASVYQGRGDLAAARGVVRYGYGQVFGGCGVIALLVCGAGVIYPEHASLLWATASLTLGLGLAEFQSHPQRATGSVCRALLPRDIGLRCGMIAIAFTSLLIGGQSLTASAAIFSMAALLAILVIGQSFLIPLTNPVKLLGKPFHTEDQIKWRRAQWGIWGNSVVAATGRNLAVLMMGAFLAPHELGAFFAALRTAMVLELALMAINIVAAPQLARHLASANFSAAQDVCHKTIAMLGVPTMLVFAVFAIRGDWVLTLFAADFGSAHLVLIVLCAGYLFSALCGPTSQVMEMSGHERAFLKMQAISTGASLLALPLATWVFGTLGAAVCVSGNLIILNLWATRHIQIHQNLRPGVLPKIWGPNP